MVDWERFERELADARRGGQMADLVVAAARRRRVRRRALLAGTALVAGAGVATGLVVSGGTPSPPPTVTSFPAIGTAAPVPPGVQAAVYAAALSGGPVPHSPARSVIVGTGVCADALPGPGDEPCRDAVLAASVRRAIATQLGPNVRFEAAPGSVSADVRTGAGAEVVVRFGRLRVSGDDARLGVTITCGAWCGQGTTLVLRRADGHWKVTGTTRPYWVS